MSVINNNIRVGVDSNVKPLDAEGLVREVVTGQMSHSQLRNKIAEHFSVDV